MIEAYRDTEHWWEQPFAKRMQGRLLLRPHGRSEGRVVCNDGTGNEWTAHRPFGYIRWYTLDTTWGTIFATRAQAAQAVCQNMSDI